MSLQREEILQKRRKTRLIKISLFFLVLGIIFGLVVYGMHRPEVRISKVDLVGGVLVTQTEVQREAVSYMSGAYYFIFPKNNYFIYPHDGLAEHLKTAFRRIDTIEISHKDWNTITVTITERKPMSLWCVDDTAPADASDCYFMDDNSTVFARAPYFSGDAYFKYYGLLASTTDPIGTEYMASTTAFRALSGFVVEVEKMGTKPVSLLAQNENEFVLTLGSRARVLFDTKAPLFKTASNLRTLLQSGTFSTLQDPTETIDYIDLRFGNKLFYKLK